MRDRREIDARSTRMSADRPPVARLTPRAPSSQVLSERAPGSVYHSNPRYLDRVVLASDEDHSRKAGTTNLTRKRALSRIADATWPTPHSPAAVSKWRAIAAESAAIPTAGSATHHHHWGEECVPQSKTPNKVRTAQVRATPATCHRPRRESAPLNAPARPCAAARAPPHSTCAHPRRAREHRTRRACGRRRRRQQRLAH